MTGSLPRVAILISGTGSNMCSIVDAAQEQSWPIDMALVDVAACDIPVPGARAIWDIERIHQLVLSMAQPGVLGLSAIGGSLPHRREMTVAPCHWRSARVASR